MLLWADFWHTALAECVGRTVIIFNYILSIREKTFHAFQFSHCRLTADTDDFAECNIFVDEVPMECVTDTGKIV